MLLKVLGTAAGGGVPQWNCACRGCAGARAHPERRRRHASLAVEAAPGRWYVINATPDIADQIERCPALHPRPGTDPRRTPLAGVVLTDAELDHTLGLARLREAERFEVIAADPVRDAVRDRQGLGELLAPYADVTWRRLPLPGSPAGPGVAGGPDSPDEPLTPGSTVHVGAVPVSGKHPRYAASAPQPTSPGASWVVALRLTDRATGRTLVYAPALGAWPDALQAAVAEADCVIVDGTFWDDEEPRATGCSDRTATAMGHLPITGPNGTARRLAGLPGRRLYTHLNNTNPLVDPDAPQHKELIRLGIEVAADGTEIVL
ncbi:pyrroloquinoline quinone biosynthesis protein PqqB [Streptomyces sp. NPDC101160]|uniref:pyrroloquinoline quinone biosynthesis protein PqqB n=1 Tax=Streptomyces sp. NPDC101160 TaxID=3366118 RepID=UPI0038258CBD